MPKFLTRILLLIVVAAFALGGASAQQATESRTAALQKSIAKIEADIEKSLANDDRLVMIRVEADKLVKELIDFGVSFRPELGTINKRLGELGQPPKEGEPAEPPEVTAERSSLLARKAAINVELGAAEKLSIRANEAISRIGDLRRDIFANTLFRRTPIAAIFVDENVQAFRNDLRQFWRTLSSRIQFVWNFRTNAFLAATGLTVLLSTVVWFLLHRTLGRFFGYWVQAGELSYFSRLSRAFWSTLIPSLTLCANLGIAYWLFFNFGIFSGQSLELVQALLVSIAAFYFIARLVLALFSPWRPDLRITRFRDPAARALFALTLGMALVYILDFFMNWVSGIFSSSLAVTVAQTVIASLLIGILLLMAAMVKPYTDKNTGEPVQWPAIIRIPLILLAAFVIGAALSGYIGLARFSAGQIIVTGAIIATMLIGLQSGRALATAGTLQGSALGRFLQGRFGFNEVSLDQLSVVLSLAIYMLVALIGLPLIALQWGFNRVDVSNFIYRLFTNIQIGSINISLFAILFGALLFILGYVLTRQFQAWLDRNVMARSRVDEGVRNSISTVTGYLGIGIAAVIGVSAAGFNLSSLAFVAGALSLGIGFGLQNIVNNFVSGLILLAERPFKVGDWIVAGQTAGTVKRISVRATEIETFQKQTVILPNSDLINQAVGNWTHRNHMGRVDIAVGVAYGTNPRQVHDLLLELAAADPSVLKVPAPFVVFTAFGDSALSFELRFHVRDVLEGSVIATRMRFAIIDAFEARGIQMPFPQRDLNLKSDDLQKLFGDLQPAPKQAKNGSKAKSGRVARGTGTRPKPAKA